VVKNLDPSLKLILVFDSKTDGSSDDGINMYTGLLIQERQMNTLVSTSGSAFSGETDLFQ
jgi:hypothetical protein